MITQFTLGILNAWIFWLLILIARYPLLRIISKDALDRAAHVPELTSKELRVYRIQTTFLFLSMVLSIFIPLQIETPFFVPGLIIFVLGYAGYITSMINFSHISNGVAATGLYKITRHPMYMTFLVIHIGIILTTLSVEYLFLIAVYQISTHWILIAEERSCLVYEGYTDYMKRVNRYCGRSFRHEKV